MLLLCYVVMLLCYVVVMMLLGCYGALSYGGYAVILLSCYAVMLMCC